MDASQVVGSFLETLEKSELLLPAQIASAADRYGLHEMSCAAEAAETLVSERIITRFQAERLLEGRSRGYFIGHYKLLEILGTGGMGWLYSAEDVNTGRKVALKVLSDNYKNDAGMLARLKLEAGVRLKHPNIVQTYKIDHTADVYDIDYVIMEWVEGIGLQELVRLQGRVPWQQACDIIRQAAAGLQHAHQTGLVHRDVKPDNFLIGHDGGVKILDFGLSLLEQARDDEFSLTMIFGHDCLGSADYMAPEQWVDSSAVDTRADIYSLGCTLYSALTGVIPFPCQTVTGKKEAHRSKQPVPLRELAPDVPEDVAAIVAKMMAKDPQERFQTAGEVCEALGPYARRQPVLFDFQVILDARAAEAKRRIAALREHRARAAASKVGQAFRPAGRLKSLPHVQPAAEPGNQPQANVETMVHEDTQPKRNVRGMIPVADPFDRLYDDASQAAGVEGSVPPDREQWGSAPLNPSHPLAWLIPVDGGEPIPLTGERMLLGRHPDCDVQLSLPKVSSRHCEVCFDGNWWRITDLDSKNGIWVNGGPVKDQLLWPGDRLTIANQYEYRFDVRANCTIRRSWEYVCLGALAATLLAAALLLAGAVCWWLLA